MSVASIRSLFAQAGLLAALLPGAPTAQEPPVAYPERDALSPFRNPTDVYAPPDELFRQLRIMQRIADRPGAPKRYEDGRELVDDPAWQQAYERVREIGIDAGQLAQMMRLHRNGLQRDTAFYAAFYVDNVDYVMELISHIPGEPLRRTREAALPRALEFLRAHLRATFGDLTDEQKQLAREALPEIGSPVAKARGIVRAPVDGDHLYTLRLVPFFQLLDVDDALDNAQALWFLKEVFTIRPDLANLWLEPALPRLEQLLLGEDARCRTEAIGIYRLLGAKDLPEPPAGDQPDALRAWAKQAARHTFPPIRNLNDAIVQLFPSEERDAIVAAGRKALEDSSIGDPFRAQREDGSWYRGFRIGYVPDELAPLAIPAKAVITTVNGTPVGTAQELLQVLEKTIQGARPRRVFVEYVRGGKDCAVEYRIM